VPDLDQLCARLFDAFVDHDLDAVEAMLAGGASITQNGTTMAWSEARPMIAALTDVIRNHRYVDVRRVVGDHAVVEEHTVVGETPAAGRSDWRRVWSCASMTTVASPRSTSTSTCPT